MAYDPFHPSSLRLRPMRPDEALQDAPDNVSPALTLTQPPPTAHQPPALAGLSSAPQAALRSPVTPSSQAVFQPTLSEPKSPAQSGLSAVAGPDAAPTPASPADWTQRAWERLSALEEKTKAQQTGDFTAGVKSGWEQTKGLGALALSALGQKTSELTDGKVGDDLQKWGYETYQKTEQAAEPYREGRTTKVEDIRGPGSAVDWLQFTLGNVAPSVAESILAGAVGAGIGAAATPAGSVLGAAGGAVGKGAIKKFLADFAEKRMVAGASREAAEKMAGAAVGAGIGTFAAGYQMGVGDVYSETLNDETGKGNATSAMLWAIPYAGIEAITDLTLAGSILKGAAGANLLKRIPAAFAKGAMLEGGQELTQETINILAGLQEGKEYRTDEVLSRLGNALAAGAVAGGVLGGAGGIRRAPDAANQDGASQNPGANPAEPASGLGSGAPAIGFNRFLERQATQLVEPPATAPDVDPETSITPALAERAAEAGLTPVDLEAANQELISPTTEDMQDGKSTIPSSTQEQNAGGTAERQASTIEAQGPEGLLSEPAPISAEAESGASGTATADTRGPAGDPVDPGAAVPAADAARAAFQPTHELSDGTPARATPEPNVYEDADGNEIEDRYATPITPERLRPAGGLETEVSPLPVGSDGNDAARLPDAAQAPDRQGMAAAPEIAPTDETLNADQTTPIETATPAETGNTGTAAPTAPAAQADAGTESAAPTPAVGTGLGAVEAGADAVPSPRQSITGGLLTDAEETVTLAALKTARNPAGYLSQRFANDPRRKQLYEEGHAANLIAAAKGQPEQDPTMGPGDGQPVVKESLTVAPVNQPPINDATPSAPTGNAPKAANEAGGDQSPTFPDASGGRIPLAQQQEIVRELADLPVVKRRFAGRKAVEKALPAGTDEQDVTRIMQALVKAAAVPTVKPEGADAAPASAPLAARWETLPAPAREAAVLAAGWTNANGGLNLAGRGIVKKQWDKISPESRAKLEGAAEPKRLDHGVLNIPGRTNGINAELDRYQAEQAKQQRADAKASAKERRTAKAKAKALFAEHGESIVSRHKDNLGEKKVRQTLDQMVKWEPEKFIALAEKHVQETQPAAETPTERAPDVLADYPDLAGKGAANTETAQQKEQTGKTFTYRVKPHPLGGFMIDSDDGGGTVIERRPRGPSVLDPVGARSFKSESDARAFMSKKGMALASDGQASGGQTAPPAGKAETKPRPLDDGEFIAIEDDPRLQDPVTLETVKRLASEAGWQEVGGKLIRNADGSVKGRTAWLPIRDWWLERPDGVTKAVVDRAMTKHAASQPLNKPERAALRFLADLATSPDSGPTFDDITEAADGDIDGASVADVRAEFDGMVDEDVFDDLADALAARYADQPLSHYVEALRDAIRARIETDRTSQQGDLPQGQGDFSLTGQSQADLDAKRQADEQRAKAEAERVKAEDAKRQADGARNAFDLSPIETNPEAQKAVDRGQTGMDFGAAESKPADQPKPDAETGGIRLSIAQTATTGMPRAQLEQRLVAILGRWTGPKTGYLVVQRESELPQPVLDALAEVRKSNPDAVVDAVMVNDEMWFVADHIASPAAAFRKLLHEGVGHIGTRRVFGNALDPVLDQIAKDRAADLTEIADTYGLDLNVTEDRREAAEELLAHLAETNIPADRPLLERVYQAIRAALRRMGIHLRMSDSDLREILSASRSLMERNDVRGAARTKGRFERGKVARGNEGRFSLAARSEIDDETGLPLNKDGTVTVYHHTSKDKAELIRKTKMLKADAEPDVYVTTHKETDTGYGDTAVAINVDPSLLQIDDEFPNGRVDYRLSVGRPGGSLKIRITKPDTEAASAPKPANAGETNPDIRFSLSGFQEQNRLIRGQDKTLWDKAKTELRRQLMPGGLLPRKVFKLKIDRDSQFEAAEMDIKSLLAHFDHAIKAAYGKPFEKLDADEQTKLNEALHFDDAAIMDQSIPEPVRVSVLAMRQYIDRMSGDYAGILFDEASKLLADGKVEQAAQRAGLLNTIANNIGQYVHRSYRAFDDPKWVGRVPDEVLDRAREYLTQRYEQKAAKRDEWADKADARGETDKADQHREAAEQLRDPQRIEKEIRLILTEGTAFDSMESFIKEGKLGAMDMSVLKQRKDIAKPIRDLLGEHTDARVNFAKSATKMSRLIWNNRFLKRVLEIGEGEFLFKDKKAAPMDVTKVIASSPNYEPLAGYYTTPEIEQAFRDALGKEEMADWYRAVVQANGLIKFGKTVLSPTTALRNWMSGYFFTVMNGHFNTSPMSVSFSAWREYLGDQDQGRLFQYLRHLKELGVVYDTPYAGEMMRLLKESEAEGKFRPENWTKISNVINVAQKFYSFGDDFWKIVGFENEKAILAKAKPNLTADEIEQQAAERIRNTYPTYSMTGRFVNSLRRFPLMGTFVSFPAEIIRTTANVIHYLREDMKDPALRPLAIRRGMGLALASGMTFAAQATLMALLGIDDDEEEAFRQLAAPWQKNSQIVPIGRDQDGNLRFLDLSFLDPYNYFKRPIVALLRDQPIDDALKSAARDAFSPFFGVDIAAGAIYEVMSNSRIATGGPIYNPQDTVVAQTEDILNHIRKAIQPGIATNLERAIKAARGDVSASGQKFTLEDEMLANLGFRVSTFNPRSALYYKSFEFNDAKSEANQILLKAIKNPNKMSEGDVESAYRRAMSARQRAFEDMSTLASGAIESGMTRAQVLETLKKSGVSGPDAAALLRGQVPKWRPTAGFMSGALRKSDAIYSRATRADFLERKRMVLRMASAGG